MTAKIKLPHHLESLILNINQIFKESSFEFYLVGGYIRNYLLGKISTDLDFTTNATPEEIIKLFKTKKNFKVIPTGIKHGTLTLFYDLPISSENPTFEVTTFRADGKYLDGRRPESVSFSQSLDEDLTRRDFTINALAYNLSTDELIDKFDGIKDLKSKVIRTIGKANERFTEDGLRMIRAARFAAQLGFTVEQATLDAMQQLAERVTLLSMERVRDELIKMLLSSSTSTTPSITSIPSTGIEILRKTSILKIILPELSNTIGVTQNHHHAYDVYHHTLKVVDHLQTFHGEKLDGSLTAGYHYQLAMAALLHDIAKPNTKAIHPETGEPTFYNHEVVGEAMAKTILQRLKFSNQDQKYICHLIRHHMFHYQSDWKDATIRRFIKKVGYEHLDELFHLVRSDRSGKKPGPYDLVKENQDITEIQNRIRIIKNEDDCLSIKELKISGKILMNEFDLQPGPELGKILNELLEEVIEYPKLNQTVLLLDLAKKYLEK